MRDTSKILRNAVFAALDGNVQYNSQDVPGFDEKKKAGDTSLLYWCFSTQQETPQNTFDSFITDSVMDIEIIDRNAYEVSKDTVDDVANAILEILFPTANSDILTWPGFLIQNFRYLGSITRVVDITPTEVIIRKFLKVQATIIQQF